jgi:hypothetical protein
MRRIDPPAAGLRLRSALAALAVLVYLGLAAATALDRLAPDHFAAERAVPEPFRVRTLAVQSNRLIEAGIPASALPGAQRLMARDPLATDSAALFGAAQLGTGNAALADRAFRLSARLGWREPRTQIYWLRTALAQGRPDLAALRFGALARQWPAAPAIAQMAALFEASPAGQLALARRIAAGDRWAQAYAQPFEELNPQDLARRAQVLQLAAGLGARLGCETAAPFVRRLAEPDPLVAARLWHGHCPLAPVPGQLGDPGFEQVPLATALTPFGWELPGEGALAVDQVEAGQQGHALEVANSGAVLLAFAAQRVPRGAGRYRIALASNARAGVLAASLSCPRDRAGSAPQALAGNAVELAFAGPCAAPWLQLWIAGGSGPVTIDNVTIAAVPR